VPEPVPEPETVIHALVVDAVHEHPACVVTVIEPELPVGDAVINDGVSE
jgi:hypothetical protein